MRFSILYLSLFLFISVKANAQSSTYFATLMSNDNEQIHFVVTVGDVFVTTLNSGQNALSQGFLQKEIDYIISVPENSLPGFKFYPNPTSGKIYLTHESLPGVKIKINQIKIYDYSGKLVYFTDRSEILTAHSEINLNAFDAGIYTVLIYFNGQKQAVRIVKI